MFLQILTFCDKKPRKRGDLSTIDENKCLKNYEILSFLNFSNHFLIDKISDKFLIPEFLVANAPNNIQILGVSSLKSQIIMLYFFVVYGDVFSMII